MYRCRYIKLIDGLDKYKILLARSLSPVNVTQHAYNYSKADHLGINAYIFNSGIINCLHFTAWLCV